MHIFNKTITGGDAIKRDVPLWQFAGFAVTSIVGTLLHFLYDLTNKNVLAALVSGVNESTFEHMKLLYFPLLWFAIFQSFFFKSYKNFWCVKLIGILFGLGLIPTLFYTINGAFGKSPDWLNISIFFVTAALTFTLESRLLKTDIPNCKAKRLAIIAAFVPALIFVLFTFYPPKLPLFIDPITGSYGL